ncbi:MAG: preprotein translocase subunit YajC [Chitinophagales bacterium]
MNNIVLLQMGGEGSALPTFIFMGAILLVMYFFMIRPQSKKAKEQKAFQESLKKGDRVVTAGGIHGKVDKISDDTVTLEVDHNSRITVEKSVVSFEYSKNQNQ